MPSILHPIRVLVVAAVATAAVVAPNVSGQARTRSTLSSNLPRMVVNPAVITMSPGTEAALTVRFVRSVPRGVNFQLFGAPKGTVLSAFPGTGYNRQLKIFIPANVTGTYPLTLFTRNPGRDRSAKFRVDVVAPAPPPVTAPPVTAPPITAPPVTAPTVTAPVVAPQFALAFEGPSTLLTRLGGAITYGVSAFRSNFAGPIAFTLQGLPGGAAAAFDPNPSNANTRLLIKTPPGTPVGNFNLLITGTAGTTTRTIVAVLQVRDSEGLNVVVGTPLPVTAGKITSVAIEVKVTNGDGQGASLITEGLPGGVTATFRSNPTAGKTTLDLTVPVNIPGGAYPFTIIATKGTVSVRAQSTLFVNVPAPTLRYQVTPVAAVPGQGSGWVLTPNTSALNVARGQVVTVDFAVTPTGGFSGAFDLVLTGLLPGSSATLTPTSTPNQVRLTMTASTQTAGSTVLVLTGTSGSLKSQNSIPLIIS